MTHPTNIVDLDTLILDTVVAQGTVLQYIASIAAPLLNKSVKLMLENAGVKSSTQVQKILLQSAYDYMEVFQSQTERRCVIRVAFTKIKELIPILSKHDE